MRFYYRRLHLERSKTDVCNVCFRIRTELADPSTSEDRKTELNMQLDMHIGKIIMVHYGFVQIITECFTCFLSCIDVLCILVILIVNMVV